MIPQGYKQTEIGVIPEDWESVALLSKCDLLNGLTYTPNDMADNGLLVIRSSNVQNNQLVFSDNVYVDLTVADEKLIKKDDIIICVRNGSAALIGKCAKASRDYSITFGAFMAVLRGENNGYIYQLLQQGTIQKHISKNSGATINQITNGDFKTIFVPFPIDAKEQEHIAEALSDVDSLIFSLETLIAKKKAVKQGAMQELLTGKKRLPGFTGEWKQNQLKHLYEIITTGKLDANAACENGRYRFYTCAKEFNYIDNYAFDGEALLISGNGENVGYIHHYIGKFNAYQRTYVLMGFKCNVSFLKQYLNYYLPTRISLEVAKSNTPYIKKDTISDMEIILPNLEEQNAIASILSDMDNEIEALEQKLEKARQIKQGMMQQLLTGKIRLV